MLSERPIVRVHNDPLRMRPVRESRLQSGRETPGRPFFGSFLCAAQRNEHKIGSHAPVLRSSLLRRVDPPRLRNDGDFKTLKGRNMNTKRQYIIPTEEISLIINLDMCSQLATIVNVRNTRYRYL